MSTTSTRPTQDTMKVMEKQKLKIRQQQSPNTENIPTAHTWQNHPEKPDRSNLSSTSPRRRPWTHPPTHPTGTSTGRVAPPTHIRSGV